MPLKCCTSSIQLDFFPSLQPGHAPFAAVAVVVVPRSEKSLSGIHFVFCISDSNLRVCLAKRASRHKQKAGRCRHSSATTGSNPAPSGRSLWNPVNIHGHRNKLCLGWLVGRVESGSCAFDAPTIVTDRGPDWTVRGRRYVCVEGWNYVISAIELNGCNVAVTLL